MMWYPTIDVRERLLRALNTVLSPLSLVVRTCEEDRTASGAAYDRERLRLEYHLHAIDEHVNRMDTTALVAGVRFHLDQALGRGVPSARAVWESLTGSLERKPQPRETLEEGLARLGVPMGPAPKKEA